MHGAVSLLSLALVDKDRSHARLYGRLGETACSLVVDDTSQVWANGWKWLGHGGRPCRPVRIHYYSPLQLRMSGAWRSFWQGSYVLVPLVCSGGRQPAIEHAVRKHWHPDTSPFKR